METNKKKVFGMTDAEIDQMKMSVMSWTDINHPLVQTEPNADGFRVAFTEGAKALIANEQTAKVFKKIHE